MKKTYIMPRTDVQPVVVQQMMAVSGELNVDSDPGKSVSDVDDLLSNEDRGWNIWGDASDGN
ncbi:MAG: hypothetical protein IJ064_04555 [Bacteroidaceae bacterium]|nr:hypothetical protein [Bacteroidaceae bacterium]